jgi:hypothetical protein
MKFEPKDLEALAAAFAKIDPALIRHHADFIRADYAKKPHKTSADAEVRIRWDIYWAAKKTYGLDFGDKYSDAHLDTALRKVLAPILNPA